MAPYKDAFDGFTDSLDGQDKSAKKAVNAGIQTAATVGISVASVASS
ncbi:hypothetical protein KBT16_09600 [Nostoc sp. CCCryo 231-06]|nr:hypothetical protein [Nostoc sp. CCCryo 231-06]